MLIFALAVVGCTQQSTDIDELPEEEEIVESNDAEVSDPGEAESTDTGDSVAPEEVTEADTQCEGAQVFYTVPTLNSAFFTTLGEGAQRAADEFNMELTFVGADLDVATQVSQVEDAIQSGADVLIIQGADSAGIVAALNIAEEAGIPVVTTGDLPDGGEIMTHIGFDNVESGIIGGEFIAEQLNGEGNVVELIGRLGTESGREKSEGLQQALDQYPGIEIIASQPAEFQRETAVTVMENIIQANPQIDAVYAANDDMALGALQALKAAGRDEGVVIIGNDGIDDAIESIRNGEMAATNATPPYRQGFIGVQVACRIAAGLSVPDYVQERNELITAENVDQADTIMLGVEPEHRYWEEQFLEE